MFTLTLLAVAALHAQTAPRTPLTPLPAPQSVPKPGPATDAPYAPTPILPGGVVVPLYPPGSSFLKAEKVREAEVYNMSQAVPGGSTASSTFTTHPSSSTLSMAVSTPVLH